MNTKPTETHYHKIIVQDDRTPVNGDVDTCKSTKSHLFELDDNGKKRHYLTTCELFDWFDDNHEQVEQKGYAKSFILHHLYGDSRARKFQDEADKKNIPVLQGISCVVYDFDDGQNIEEICSALEQHNINHYLYHSFSSSKEKHKFRVIIPFNKVITEINNKPLNTDVLLKAKHKDIQIDSLFNSCDPASFKVKQPYYCPSRQQDDIEDFPSIRYEEGQDVDPHDWFLFDTLDEETKQFNKTTNTNPYRECDFQQLNSFTHEQVADGTSDYALFRYAQLLPWQQHPTKFDEQQAIEQIKIFDKQIAKPDHQSRHNNDSDLEAKVKRSYKFYNKQQHNDVNVLLQEHNTSSIIVQPFFIRAKDYFTRIWTKADDTQKAQLLRSAANTDELYNICKYVFNGKEICTNIHTNKIMVYPPYHNDPKHPDNPTSQDIITILCDNYKTVWGKNITTKNMNESVQHMLTKYKLFRNPFKPLVQQLIIPDESVWLDFCNRFPCDMHDDIRNAVLLLLFKQLYICISSEEIQKDGLENGLVFILSGPNGVGKSTFIRLCGFNDKINGGVKVGVRLNPNNKFSTAQAMKSNITLIDDKQDIFDAEGGEFLLTLADSPMDIIDTKNQLEYDKPRSTVLTIGTNNSTPLKHHNTRKFGSLIFKQHTSDDGTPNIRIRFDTDPQTGKRSLPINKVFGYIHYLFLLWENQNPGKSHQLFIFDQQLLNKININNKRLLKTNRIMDIVQKHIVLNPHSAEIYHNMKYTKTKLLSYRQILEQIRNICSLQQDDVYPDGIKTPVFKPSEIDSKEQSIKQYLSSVKIPQKGQNNFKFWVSEEFNSGVITL